LLVLIVLAGMAAAWRLWLGAPPSLTADPVRLAKFASSPKFEALPDEQRRQYMDAVREGKDDWYEAYAKHQLTSQQYENALLNAWISRSLEHSNEYALLRAGTPRQIFLDRIVRKGEKKRLATTRPAQSTLFDKDPYDLDEVKKLVAGWPPERRAQWEEFRKAVRERQAALGVKPRSGIWY
jgi:hypothetical protein